MGSQAAPSTRQAVWFTDCYCRYYYGNLVFPHVAMPEFLREALGKVMEMMGVTDEELWPNCCNVNMYAKESDKLPWHADDEPIFNATNMDTKIVSLSLGSTRLFKWKEKVSLPQATNAGSMELKHGDIMVMEGQFQKTFVHMIDVAPKGGQDRPRINITWRWITQHENQCQRQKADSSRVALGETKAPTGKARVRKPKVSTPRGSAGSGSAGAAESEGMQTDQDEAMGETGSAQSPQ